MLTNNIIIAHLEKKRNSYLAQEQYWEQVYSQNEKLTKQYEKRINELHSVKKLTPDQYSKIIDAKAQSKSIAIYALTRCSKLNEKAKKASNLIAILK